MNRNLFREKKFVKSSLSIAICFVLLASLLVATTVTSENIERNNLSYTFEFQEPGYRTISVTNMEYTEIDMAGCIGIGKQAGEPTLPVKNVKLLIPPMKTVKNLEITGTPVEIDTVEIPVVPYQNPIPFGSTPEEYVVNEEVYASSMSYPDSLYDNYHVAYCRGYSIFDVTLNPMEYIPNEGKLFYYPEITVNIELDDSGIINQFFRDNTEDEAWVQGLVYNPVVAEMYQGISPTFYDGGLCDPADQYDYVIITTEHNGLDYWDTTGEIPYNWDSLIDWHTERDGLTCTLVTVQDIDDCEDYHNEDPLFNDQEAHIREFCKDAYQDWETSYIFIGADAEWIPARLMTYQYEPNCDSDLYWSNLDNTFNEDHDTRWGEEGDAGFDLYSELFIGRITCDEPKDVSNWMTKSFYYADSLETDYLDNAAFYGGNTGWQCEGDDFVDFAAIKGTDNWLGPNPEDNGPFPTWLGFLYGFETWNEEHPEDAFDLSVAWTSESPNEGWQGGNAEQGLRTAINEDRVTMIHGIAHANAEMSLDVHMDTWESSYTNTKPFFIHDFGCHCGDMDARDDGVLHSMLFHSDTELAFACIYHTGYGWGAFECTNSSSALFMKLCVDYLFDLDNSGYPTEWQLGKMMSFAKDAMAPTIDWSPPGAPGSFRGTIEMCLLFGDPAQKLKNPHPNLPPDTPTIPDGPDVWAQYGEAEFSSTSTDPDGDSIYFLFDWGDGTDSGWLGPYASGQTAASTHSWDITGDYEIKVMVRDDLFGQSPWTEPHMLTIVENEPPAAPTMTDGPSAGKSKTLLRFKFTTNDPEENDVYYMITWGDGDFELWDGPYAPGEEVEFGHAWSENGEYNIVVKAKDQYGSEGAQSSFKLKIGRSRTIMNPFLQQFLERYPNMFPILRKVLGL